MGMEYICERGVEPHVMILPLIPLPSHLQYLYPNRHRLDRIPHILRKPFHATALTLDMLEQLTQCSKFLITTSSSDRAPILLLLMGRAVQVRVQTTKVHKHIVTEDTLECGH